MFDIPLIAAIISFIVIVVATLWSMRKIGRSNMSFDEAFAAAMTLVIAGFIGAILSAIVSYAFFSTVA